MANQPRAFAGKALAGRAAAALQRFTELVDSLAQETAELPLHVQTDRVIKDSGLWLMYEQEKAKRPDAHRKLRGTGKRHASVQLPDEDEDLMPLQAFLSHAALEAGEGRGQMAGRGAADDHACGERAGVQSGIYRWYGRGMFPSQMALDEGGRLEEERRLAYVGVTRAMKS